MLVRLAEQRVPPSPYLTVRHRAVLEQREPLLLLAERLNQPEPIEVDVIAQLWLLVSDSSSPAYVGGAPADGVAEIAARCVAQGLGRRRA